MTTSFDTGTLDEKTPTVLRRLSRAAEYAPVLALLLAGIGTAMQGWQLRHLLTTLAITLVCAVGARYLRNRRTGELALFGTVAIDRDTDQSTRELVDWGVLSISLCCPVFSAALLIRSIT